MPRLNVVEPDQAEGEVREIYDAIEEQFGSVPELMKGLANSPAALRAYLSMEEALEDSALSEAERHAVYLIVSQRNECDYCLAAHTALGKQCGLEDETLLGVRKGKVEDETLQALVDFARSVAQNRGYVSDADLCEFHNAGYTDAHAAEVVAVLAEATFSNFFNHVHDTPVDFPEAPEL